MTSEEHAAIVGFLVRRLYARVMGPGEAQYSQGDVQRFESRALRDIVEDSLEEVEDLIVYAVQLWIRLDGLQDAVERLDGAGGVVGMAGDSGASDGR